MSNPIKTRIETFKSLFWIVILKLIGIGILFSFVKSDVYTYIIYFFIELFFLSYIYYYYIKKNIFYYTFIGYNFNFCLCIVILFSSIMFFSIYLTYELNIFLIISIINIINVLIMIIYFNKNLNDLKKIDNIEEISIIDLRNNIVDIPHICDGIKEEVKVYIDNNLPTYNQAIKLPPLLNK